MLIYWGEKETPLWMETYVKEWMMETVGEECPEKLNLFKIISLSLMHVEFTILEIVFSRKSQRFTRYSLDESTDVSDTSQYLIFVRGVDDELNIAQDLAQHYKWGRYLQRNTKKCWQNITCIGIDSKV